MVQTVTLDLSALNQIPGVSGVEDVEFRVPELSDIEAAIDEFTIDLPDVEEIILEAVLGDEDLRDVFTDILEDVAAGEPLPQAVATAVIEEVTAEALGLEDIEIPTAEEIAELVVDQLDLGEITTVTVDIEGSLFDIETDLIDLLEELFRQADLSGLVGDLPLPEDLPRVVEAAVRLLDRFGGEIDRFIQDPTGAATDWTLTLLRAANEEADLVSDEAQAGLTDSLTALEDALEDDTTDGTP